MKRNIISFLMILIINLASKSTGRIGPDAIFRLSMGCDIDQRQIYWYLVIFQLGIVAIYTILFELKIEESLSIGQYIIARGNYPTLRRYLIIEICKTGSLILFYKLLLYVLFCFFSGEYYSFCLYDIISTAFSIYLLAFFILLLNILRINKYVILFLGLFASLFLKIGSFYFSFLGWLTIASPSWENNIAEMLLFKIIFISILWYMINKADYERIYLGKDSL